MTLVEKSQQWERSGLLDSTKDRFCQILHHELLTRKDLEVCFVKNVPVFAVVAQKELQIEDEEELTHVLLSAFIIDYCVRHRQQCIEVCLLTIQNKRRPEEELLGDPIRETENQQ